MPTEDAEDSYNPKDAEDLVPEDGLDDPHQIQADGALLETAVTETNFQQQAAALQRDFKRKSMNLPCAWGVYRDSQVVEEEAKTKEEMKKAQVASPARRRTQSTPSASSVPQRKGSTKAKDCPKKAKKTVNKHQKSKGKKKLTGVELKKKLHSATTLHFITI